MEGIQNRKLGNIGEEVDLITLLKVIWLKRVVILKITTTFIALGFLVAILSPKEFEATSSYLPTTSDSGKAGGRLSSLASVAGINLGGIEGGEDIPPSLYPNIVKSIPFKKDMLNAQLSIKGLNNKVTYREYYEKYFSPSYLAILKQYTIGLPRVIIGVLKRKKDDQEQISNSDKDIVSLSPTEMAHYKRLDNQIFISYNEKEGVLRLICKMPEPLAAAQLAKYAEGVLQKQVIAFKVRNAKEQLIFTQERHNEKKKEFENIQTRLARFRDRNQNISSSIALSQLRELEAEYSLTLSVFTELAKQLETAKLQVSKETPVFSVIQPISVPMEKAGPNRMLIVLISIILGIFVSILIVFGTEYFFFLREQIDKAS
ncbi:exopolysaccharide biosynthesis protein [Echinicola strongylocentroti]|uniref:Exopolysaccharide biosynthesis protein n=1 Tax=Echinicola strongylocentroti TaxID=1795355 RepID=A0A2Z4INA4_9BACT|nr:Wzz/FepE/Etk N-terminal domain-containing protein [Echinicola strongylocentroti]AWW32219.1 exopolysaccharide biosynthesis protein [Echinicola strongylocentroti]